MYNKRKTYRYVVSIILIFSIVLGELCKYSNISVADELRPNKYIDDSVEFNGHNYKVFEQGTVEKWEDAEKYCELIGGYLATISSQEENDFLFNYIKSKGIESAYFGYSDSKNEGEWKWVRDEGAEYTNWNIAEPNNESGKENYAMFYTGYPDGTWNDGDFQYNSTYNDNLAFICEWDTNQKYNTFTFYVKKPYNWSGLGTYLWSDTEEVLGRWPGYKMKKCGDKWGYYSITVNTHNTKVHAVFNNGIITNGSLQTVDIEGFSPGTYWIDIYGESDEFGFSSSKLYYVIVSDIPPVDWYNSTESNTTVENILIDEENISEIMVSTLSEDDAWNLLKFLNLNKMYDQKSDLYKYMAGKENYTAEEQTFFKTIILMSLYTSVETTHERLYGIRDELRDKLIDRIKVTDFKSAAKLIIKKVVDKFFKKLIPGFDIYKMIKGEYGNITSILSWVNLAEKLANIISNKYGGAYILDYINLHHRDGYSDWHEMALSMACPNPRYERWAHYLYNLSRTVDLPMYSKTSVHCPVDLAINNEKGEQVLLLTNEMLGHSVTSYGEFTVVYDEETEEYHKTAILYDSSYSLEIIGTGDGMMDIEHINYSGEEPIVSKASEVVVYENNSYILEEDEESLVLNSNNDTVQTDIEIESKPISVESIEISNEELEIAIGESVVIETDVKPINLNNIVVISDNEEVVSVNSGKIITGVASGTATISVFVEGFEDVVVEKNVTVTEDRRVTSIESEQNECELKKGEIYDFDVTTLPEDVEEDIYWYSTDESIATVDDEGVVTAHEIGQVSIIAETASGNASKSFIVIVNEGIYPLKVETIGTGTVSGIDAIYEIGDEAILCAETTDKCSEFDGWYLGNDTTKISNYKVFKYEIPDTETYLVAKFKEVHTDIDSNSICDICCNDISGITAIELDTDGKINYYAKISEKYNNVQMIYVYKDTKEVVNGVYDANNNLYKFVYDIGNNQTIDDAIFAILVNENKVIDYKSSEMFANDMDVKLSESVYIYDGTSKQPEVVVEGMTEGVDYSVEYINNVNIGTATVIITGIGRYVGRVTKTFTIKSIEGQEEESTKPPTEEKEDKPTNPSEVKPTTTKPSKVKTLKQKAKYSTSMITLRWNKVKNSSGYEIYRATSKKGKYTKVATTKKTSYKNTKLKAGKTYYYKVRAYKMVNGSKIYGKSSDIKAMGTKPKKPSIKVSAGKNKAKVTWEKISGVSGYDVYMSTSKSGKYKKIKTLAAKKASFTQKKLTNGKKYYFKARTYRKINGKKVYSGWSNVKSTKWRK